jgi:UDP:flavonoid glycosyltransferase YjiC (YdhE family)
MMSLGGLIDREQLGELPPNVYVYPWLPQLQILERADCSINHGGIHTINECIHFKVPMLVYSGKRSDQNGCAARVAYHQLGLIGDKDQDSVVQIREKIRKVLTDGEIRRNVELMYEHCCRYRDERCVEKLTSAALQKKKEIKATDGKPLV